MKEIIEEVMKLSLVEKENLAAELLRMIRQERLQEKASRLVPFRLVEETACSIVGIAEYRPGTKDRKDVTAAILMSSFLLRMGLDETETGELVGKHRTSVCHYKNILKDWREFPQVFREENGYLNEMDRYYETITGTV